MQDAGIRIVYSLAVVGCAISSTINDGHAPTPSHPANAALRSIVRRDTGENYQDVLATLAQASGIERPRG